MLASAAVGVALAILLIVVVGGAVMTVLMRDDSARAQKAPVSFQVSAGEAGGACARRGLATDADQIRTDS